MVFLLVLVAYPLSYGPYNWLWFKGLIPGPLASCGEWFYMPLRWMIYNGPHSMMDLFDRYMQYWIPAWPPPG